jgi:hypothetical protein
MKYSTLTGSFSYDGINEFLRDLSYGKGRTNPVKGQPSRSVSLHIQISFYFQLIPSVKIMKLRNVTSMVRKAGVNQCCACVSGELSSVTCGSKGEKKKKKIYVELSEEQNVMTFGLLIFRMYENINLKTLKCILIKCLIFFSALCSMVCNLYLGQVPNKINPDPRRRWTRVLFS